MPRSKLLPSDITAIIDTREQTPWGLEPLQTIRGTLDTGDYSVVGLEHRIRLERKSLPDLLQCIGNERQRFERELSRLLAYPSRMVVVETTWQEFTLGGWQSKVTPESAMGSVIGWMAQGIPFHFAGRPADASQFAARFMFIAARRHWAELQSFCSSLKIAT